MRVKVLVAAAAYAALAMLASAGCAGPRSVPLASFGSCREFGVRAIDRRVVVHAIPRACAGLSASQVNQAVGSAIREAVGPRPKAAARRLAVRDGRYVAPLIRAVRRAVAQQPIVSAPAPVPGRSFAVAGLACWLVTAAAGAYLLVRSGMLGGLSRRAATSRRRPPAVVLGHVTVATVGLAVWIAFTVSGSGALGWIAVGLVMTVAGLGIATLLGGLPEAGTGQPTPRMSARLRAEAPVIAAHGVLATVTIVVIILGATAAR